MSSYKIVYVIDNGSMHETIKNLEKEVNFLLKEGWSCIGGFLIKYDEHDHSTFMYQTMVKLPV